MATDSIKKNGTLPMYKNDRGGATLITEPVIGVVKSNIDSTRSGKIQVYISNFGATDADDPLGWTPVYYMSPFAGLVTPNGNPEKGSDKTGNGEFVGNPQSYGFWATAPDIGTQVICIFVNGRIDQGYYIGCIPQTGLNQMTPAIGASTNVVPNATEGSSYGGADRLPTSEANFSNPAVKKSPQIYNEPKAIHSYQASILNAQGLIRDNVRGVISSSAQRESPSRVFGMSTPGGPIFEGGYTNQTIKEAAKTAAPEKLKQIGRTGGHTFVMDDGTLTGDDQLIRLRSSAGHQITMSDSGQTLFIIHSNGQSWIEMGREGTIDIYSTNSFNVRTQGDINFHADRDINLNAAKNLNLFGENVNIETAKNYTQRVGVNSSYYTMGTYTVKVDGAMSQASGGQASYRSSAETFINGSKVNLNSGTAGLQPATVPVIQKTNHIDTTNSPSVGWMNPSPEPLVSITNRAPAHQPWIGSGKGVDVKVSSAPPSGATETPAAQAVNAATPAVPTAPVSAAAISAAPAAAAVASVPATSVQALTAQVATSAQAAVTQAAAAAGTSVAAAANAAGVINIASGVTAGMAEAAGALKKGSADLAAGLAANGQPLEKSLGAVTTGVATATSLLTSAQTGAGIVQAQIGTAAQGLLNAGILTGKEGPAAAGGLIMGAVTSGIGAVKDFVADGVSKVTGLADNIAGGKFAAGLADGLSMKGLSASLGGLADGLKGKVVALGDSIGNLTASLKSGLQNAFVSVEKSFGTLKAGVANVLGPKSTGPAATQQPSAVAQAGNAYSSAEAEVSSARDALLDAKRNYRNEQTPETTAALSAAEAVVSASVQKQAQASQAFLKSAGGGAVETAKTAIGQLGNLPGVSDIKTTLNTGLNALPGGAAVFQSVVNNSGIGAAAAQGTAALGAVNSALAGIGGLTGGKSSLVGDLVGKTTAVVGGAVGGALGSVTGALDKLKAGSAGIMGQLEASLSSITSGANSVKSAAAAVGTFDKSALIAKTGQLLGNPKIPAPVFNENPQAAPADPNVQSAEVTVALEAVKDAQFKVKIAKLSVAIQSDSLDGPNGPARLVQATEMLTKEEAALKIAQDAYTALVTA